MQQHNKQSTINHKFFHPTFEVLFFSMSKKRSSTPAFGAETDDAKRLLHMFLSGELDLKVQPQQTLDLFPNQAVLPADKFRSGFNRVRQRAEKMLQQSQVADYPPKKGMLWLIVCFGSVVVVLLLTVVS
jgi:hypothetical protein